MLFSDITDCEMLVYRCIQEADNEIVPSYCRNITNLLQCICT